MNNPWAFLPARDSNELIDDDGALRTRMDEDGYLLFREILPSDALKVVRRDMLEVLAEHEWIVGGDRQHRALALVPPYMESDPEFKEVYRAVQRLQSFHELAHHPSLVTLMKKVVGPTAFPHPLKVARIAIPGNYETATPPHQDYPNNQGTPALTASWVPLGDISSTLGGLAILRGSHRAGVLDLKGHLGPGNRQAFVPAELLERCRWVTTDYALGDVLLFPSTTVHASLNNASQGVMRLSVDFRWQQESEALTPGCLEPHGGDITWGDIYEGWDSDRLQYYWRDLDFEVETMRPYEVLLDDHSNMEMLKLTMQYLKRRERFTPPAHAGS